jgi:PAS domain S-box-containing protein
VNNDDALPPAMRMMDTVLDKHEVQSEINARFFWLSPDMLCIVSLDGYLVQVNPAWQKGLGYSAEEVSRQPIFNFIHPDDLPEVATITELESARASTDLEF